ncbi:hypothetical protein DSO57_1023841 [Entomophthora muscae]|uniref:Uncharacterized protein n=1 Tax=Entomophthora muscae TaxID=34485 RepID=A0ACC2RHB9_9FUNG|nr:hypothetical protein DSO57_1023841 [Entomophthora muscae]
MKLCFSLLVSVVFSGVVGNPTRRVPYVAVDGEELDVFDVLDSTNKSLVSSTQVLATHKDSSLFEAPKKDSMSEESVAFDTPRRSKARPSTVSSTFLSGVGFNGTAASPSPVSPSSMSEESFDETSEGPSMISPVSMPDETDEGPFGRPSLIPPVSIHNTNFDEASDEASGRPSLMAPVPLSDESFSRPPGMSPVSMPDAPFDESVQQPPIVPSPVFPSMPRANLDGPADDAIVHLAPQLSTDSSDAEFSESDDAPGRPLPRAPASMLASPILDTAGEADDLSSDDSDSRPITTLDPESYYPSTFESHQRFDNDLAKLSKQRHHSSHHPHSSKEIIKDQLMD